MMPASLANLEPMRIAAPRLWTRWRRLLVSAAQTHIADTQRSSDIHRTHAQGRAALMLGGAGGGGEEAQQRTEDRQTRGGREFLLHAPQREILVGRARSSLTSSSKSVEHGERKDRS
jgi:hypothetical protein